MIRTDYFVYIDHRKRFTRLNATMKNWILFLYKKLANLNIFLIRDFGSTIDRTTAKRLGQWATFLYIVFFVFSIVILALYVLVQPHTVTNSFEKPSLNLYKQLFQRYKNDLKCPCSSISSINRRFVT